jgi:outer membrane protein assembly factor BamB
MNKRILFLLAASASLSSCSYMPSWMGGKVEEKPKLLGERKVALEVDSGLAPDNELINSKPVLPSVTANADWSQHSGVFTAVTGNIAGGKFDIKTSAKAGDGNSFSHSLVPRPVVAGGMVFVMDAAGIISAHDAVNISEVRWKSSVIADVDEYEVIGGGLAVSGDNLYATTGQGQVAALNAKNGKELWQKNFFVPMRGSPRVAGNLVIVMTIDSQTYALSTKTGDILWTHRGINETSAVMNSVSPTIAGNDVLVPYSSGELFALSILDGKELWNDSLLTNKYTQASSVFTGIGADPVVDGEFAFVTSNGGVTAAINIPRGRRVWQQKAASLNAPWLAGNELFLLTADNTLVDFVKYDGKIRWTTALASYEDSENKLNPISWRGPVLVAGNLLVVSSNGNLVIVSATTGKIIETKSIPSDIVTAPVVAGGRLYLVGQDATLYSFQ